MESWSIADIWEEVRALRDGVVEPSLELGNMEDRLKDNGKKVKVLKAEPTNQKVN